MVIKLRDSVVPRMTLYELGKNLRENASIILEAFLSTFCLFQRPPVYICSLLKESRLDGALIPVVMDDKIKLAFNISILSFSSLRFAVAHMHGLAVLIKEELPFAWEKSVDSYLYFRLALLHSVCYFFPSVDHLRVWAQFLILIHLT